MIWKTKFKIIKINDSMFDVIKEILISEKEFTETNYKRLPSLHRKQFNRFWWWYRFNSGIFDINK